MTMSIISKLITHKPTVTDRNSDVIHIPKVHGSTHSLRQTVECCKTVCIERP